MKVFELIQYKRSRKFYFLDRLYFKDQNEKDAVRYKGNVVNLLVVDGKDVQTKIKLGKPAEDKSKEEQPKKVRRNSIYKTAQFHLINSLILQKYLIKAWEVKTS